jgi:chemotaxis protein CheD
MMTRFDPDLGRDVVTIGVGEMHVSNDGQGVATLLGTCVAVALYDTVGGVGGLNHFMLAEGGTAHELAGRDGGRYGVEAMRRLVDRLVACGARPERLEAKVFGGGSRILQTECGEGRIATDNVKIACDFLRDRGIPVRAADVGGSYARRLVLLSESGRVFVRRIHWELVED